MAIGTQDESDSLMGEINMIPFIDVMLVLLIIFIITVPVIQHAVRLELPQASNQPIQDQAKSVRLSVNAGGAYFWNGQSLSDGELQSQLQIAAAEHPQPELHIHGDKAARYERVALAMAAAHRAGITKMGFITEPAR